ncbi:MAG: TolC family protein [Verrucomicrobiota bacterium]
MNTASRNLGNNEIVLLGCEPASRFPPGRIAVTHPLTDVSSSQRVQFKTDCPQSRCRTTALHWTFFWSGVVVFLFTACSTSHYRRSADKQVLQIIQNVEKQVFGQTNAFTIETSYSHRKPEEISPAELIGDRVKTNQRLLTIEAALDLALSSRRFQAEKERLYLTALTLTGERHQFSPQFFAGSSASWNRSSSGDQSTSVNSAIGVNQLLMSGGRLGVNLANDILRYYTGDPRRSVVSSMSVNLVQPLLRGLGRNNAAVESLTQAERNVVYAVRNFGFFQDQFALEIVNDYFGLLAQKDIVRNRYTNFLSRVQATRRLEARADRERRLDADQARQAELTAKNNYVNSVASYRNALDQFKIKLGLPLGERIFLDDSALVDVEQTGLVPVRLHVDEAYRLATQRQFEILNAIDQFEDMKRKVRVAMDRLKPDLNLIANASLDSERPTDYTRFDPDDIRAGIGLELDLPIDRLRERNSYRATLVTFESELRSLTLTLDTLKENIDRGLRTLEQRRQNYEIQRNALDLANRRVAITPMLQEAGKAEVRDLVEAQDAQIAAQNAVTAALVDYQEARLQLMLDLGALQTETPKFWLKDHLENFFPSGPPQAVPVPADQAVISPDDYFNN